MFEIRDLVSQDHETVLTMNNAAVPDVNAHDEQSLQALLGRADRAWVADRSPTASTAVISTVPSQPSALGGLLVTFAPGSTYESRNYTWLSERYDNFGYVDRIIIAPAHRRRGLAGRLYETLAAHARAEGRHQLLCEVNVVPPNPRSVAFHEASGWNAIGELEHGPGKTVRFFEFVL
ncbi:MAG: GNAT family N-acetyltransferase [Acidimicrobiia bacterium]